MLLNNKEAINLLGTRLKPYLQIKPAMLQTTYSSTKRNIELEISKPKTVENFLRKFGFDGTYNNWQLDFNNWQLKSK